MKHKVLLILIFFLSKNQAYGQRQESWTVFVLKKGKTRELRDDMTTVSDHGFYLLRNCLYDINLQRKERYSARLIDIKKDTLIFTTHFNQSVAKKMNQKFDTLYLKKEDISKISLIEDRIFGFYSSINLDHYDVSYQLDTTYTEFPVDSIQIFRTSSTKYEVLPMLTAQCIDWVYEKDGRVYFYEGIITSSTPPSNLVYKETAVSFLPTLNPEVDLVNGLAIGFLAIPESEDTLTIKGVCIEVFPLTAFGLVFGSFLMPDKVLHQEPNPSVMMINGFNISVGGSCGDSEITGAYIGGAVTYANKLKGFSLTGIHTITYEFEGVCISGLRNQAKKGKGLQLGLFNSTTKHFKGIQIGLWNKNQKRSLPFFNWNF